MQVSLLETKSIARKLSALIEKHDRISIAVAWGGMTEVAETLLAHKAKFEAVLIGLDFCSTDPALIQRLVDVPNAFVTKNRPGCFHPKIFYFETGAKAEAIVGSANFTGGGLVSNLEAGVHVRGAVNDPFFGQLRSVLEGYAELYLPITKALADSYRQQAMAAAKQPRPKNPVLPNDRKNWERVTSPLATMAWQDFVKAARQDVGHGSKFKNRMKLIRKIQQMFAKSRSFADLSVAEWKGIAGVLGQREAEEAGLDDFDWGSFGSMTASGIFAQEIGRQNGAVATALDAIPLRGAVTKAHFDAFAASFTNAFEGAARIPRLAPATRLLAMKRPDLFVCVDGDNRAGLAKALSTKPTTLGLDNYWERVIDPIRQAPWYNAPRPEGRDMELWDARVAMLDAIYYEPTRK
jgi:HKD family nuclease